MAITEHPLRVFILDDHLNVLQALGAQFAACPEISLLGTEASFDESVRRVNLFRPDVVLVETKRADGRGLELVQVLLHQASPNTRIVVLTSYFNEWERETLTCVGIKEYLLKDIASNQLIQQLTALAV